MLINFLISIKRIIKNPYAPENVNEVFDTIFMCIDVLKY